MTHGFDSSYPRDLVGYGPHPPDPQWPGGARIAVQFVLNYEEGGENNVLHGDEASETFLSEIVGAQPFPNRHMSMESIYEYGSRAGLWRVLGRSSDAGCRSRLRRGKALQRNPEAVEACRELGHEIACHGCAGSATSTSTRTTEREHMAEAVEILRDLTGERTAGLVHRPRLARTPGSWWSSTAASSTTPILTPTTSRTG